MSTDIEMSTGMEMSTTIPTMSRVAPASRHAVVVGGSLAGLCAARALADHVDRVTVLERDRYPDGPRVRPGVPQAHHLHVLVTSGQQALDRLFPGFLAELTAHGAVPVDVPTDVLYLTSSGWRERFSATHRLVGASRELVEWIVHRRLRADDRIRILGGQEVVGLLPDGSGGGVAGVAVRARGGDGRVERIAADLVVDASGRGSRAPEWLAELGYGRPAQPRVDARLGYASRRYTLPAGVADGWKHILIMPNPPEETRSAVLYPLEHGRWMLTLGGIGDDAPPTDEAGFLAYLRGLRTPIMYEVIRRAEPAGPIHGFRRTSNHRRHYESMPRWPHGFLVVGDAACAFNPVYGHGMSVAARTAVVLAEHLRRHPGVPGRAAQAAVARCSATAWAIATAADLRFPGTTGDLRRRDGRLSRWYLDRVARVANRDPEVARTLTDVFHLVAPPATLLAPRTVARVLRGPVRPPLTEPPVTAAPDRDGE